MPPATPLLSKIDSPADLRRLPESDVRAAADELRAHLIESSASPAGISVPASAWWN